MRDFKNNVQIVFQFTDDADKYLSQSVCAVMLYDITNYQSLQAVKQSYLEHAQKQMHSEYSFIYLLGNKMDLDTVEAKSVREVEFDEA